jgi:hypothetical protein
LNGRIAYVGTDHQIHLIDADGGDYRQITLSLGDNPLLLWGRPSMPSSAHTWPTWSPDGRRLICFELPGGDDVSGPILVQVIDADGVRQVQMLAISGRLPIYAAWSPDGAGAAILLQEEDHLALGWASPDNPGRLRILEEGSPLFFSWHPTDHRPLIHVGGLTGRSRLIYRDVSGGLPDEVLPQLPGNYCVPIVVGDRLVQVDRSRSVNRLVSTDLSGEDERLLLEFTGLGALAPAPGEDAVVFSAAPGGEGHPYRGATLLYLDGRPPARLTEDDCFAFFWSRALSALIYARVLNEERCVTFNRCDVGGEPEEIARFWPSREMQFYLRFFDQFIMSHSLLSPEGDVLVFSGRLIGADEDPPRSRRHGSEPRGDDPHILVADLRRRGEIHPIASGSFACFSPVSGRES